MQDQWAEANNGGTVRRYEEERWKRTARFGIHSRSCLRWFLWMSQNRKVGLNKMIEAICCSNVLCLKQNELWLIPYLFVTIPSMTRCAQQVTCLHSVMLWNRILLSIWFKSIIRYSNWLEWKIPTSIGLIFYEEMWTNHTKIYRGIDFWVLSSQKIFLSSLFLFSRQRFSHRVRAVARER